MSPMHRCEFVAAMPVLLAGAGCSTPAPPPSPPPSPAPAAAGAPRPWTDQPAFSLVRVDVRDGKAFGEYVVGHAPTIAAAGGRFLAAGSQPQTVEGEWPARRMVLHQWPNATAFLDWYASPAYAPWKQRRHGASSANVILVQGVAAAPASPEVPPAFTLVDIDVREGAGFGRYVQGHTPSLLQAGGMFLVAGGRVEVIEDSWSPQRVVLHRWSDAAAFWRWYESPEYRPWRDLRHGVSKANVVIVEGLSDKTKAERNLP